MTEGGCPTCGSAIDAGGRYCSVCGTAQDLTATAHPSEETATEPHRATGLHAGQNVAGYRIVGLIKRGGMGAVYEAVQLSLDRRVAFKLLDPELSADPSFVERFRREARAAAALRHPNILTVHESGTLEDGRLFISMALVDGPDLGLMVREQGPLAAELAVSLLAQIGDALDAAHAARLVHRDIKPANVLVEEAPAGPRAYLADFGLVKADEAPAELTRTGQLLGTPAYMAPEQIAGGSVDGRADVYAFGATLYYALTGQPPYPHPNETAMLIAHVREPIPVPSQLVATVPPVLDEAVRRAMEKEPSHRASSAGQLMAWVRVRSALLDRAPAPFREAGAKHAEGKSGGGAAGARLAAVIASYCMLWTLAYVIARGA